MSSLAQQQVDLSKTWRGNTKYWQELVFSFPASSKINLNLRLSNRYSNEIKNYSQFIEAGFKYSFLEKVKLHSEFLFRRELYELTDWRANEHRVTLGTGLSFKLGKWSFSNRHRMEWRIFENTENKQRYRTRLKVEPSWQWTKWNIKPYSATELFVTDRKLNHNRLTWGLKSNKGIVSPALEYVLHSTQIKNSWFHEGVTTLRLTIKLKHRKINNLNKGSNREDDID